ncbi:MAG TPA: YggS family pyridoxal phosphate-dependent enzyme [Bacteroidales bacterium]|nr:YggS family pyridoxal phosphate-dependent enzyme [Bacteroidales bacterium]HPL04046.1 YggS family pyridoxal phosphate-dependent enzyme [Bacteroidales bacterium]
MSEIKKNIDNIIKQIPNTTKLVAVSKTHSIETIKETFDAGQRDFGENKVQEMVDKHNQLQNPEIKWHLIGHLQRNKVKYIADFVELIHSVDSLRLLTEINRQAKRHNRIINCLLQFHIADEDTKFGLNFDEAINILESDEFKSFGNIKICGVMGMATFTDNSEQVRHEFKKLKEIFSKIKDKYFKNLDYFCEISMGMSGDWKIAIEEGATILRIGSIIFGNRT